MNFESSTISRTVPAGDDLEANRTPHWPGQTKNDGNDDGPNVEVAASVKHMKGIPSRWYRKVLDAGVEENGILPVPIEERTQTQHSNLFTVFFTCLLCVLPLPTGALGTTVYGLKLRDVSLIILFFNFVTCIPPAIMGIGGYQTGMRQMIQARYSFGFVAALLGYRAIHAWQRWQWLPNLIAIAIAAGCGGKQLMQQVEHEPATVKGVIGYGSLMAGYFMTFGGTVSDFTIYHDPKEPKRKVFTYVYLGLSTPATPLLILGAAIGGAIPNNESWQTAWDVYGVGGVLAEMLAPAGGFGKFVLVVLALSVVGNTLNSMYSVALCLQMLLPVFTKVPRFFFIIVTMAIMIPMAIYAAAEWTTSLENFLSIIGYWAGCFDAIMIEELVVFRKRDYSSYDPEIWNKGRYLPTGLAAMGASLVSLGLVIPSMDTPWFTGPIGERIGDLGFEAAFVVTGLAYYPLRSLEIKWTGRI
ncbi:hypothetical protein B0J15DRAFT_507116 [Fusarium solani]|uniref:Purine-cytosine permease n=1 Tax=Fusarium solani TaxID=169388 RepID=A0A9P9RD81_FUSSL|nr:uncharacterized protein B0J15DRAFT_507116 [Fusarium solani]KAH7275301.1 hypothetical protein B0J15DRAFT_507116 [Fusarium solani]